MDDEQDAVFKALADPTRRAVLDALYDLDGQTVRALCERHAEMTRFGVMKHLAILEAANLIVTRKEGRTKRHFLNPIPIQQISDRWIDKYGRPFTRAMTDLQRDLQPLDRLPLDRQLLERQLLDRRPLDRRPLDREPLEGTS